MKKLMLYAILLLFVGCYTPMNNSGMATTKSWLEIPAKKTDFNGKIYDICYQFNIRFTSEDALEKISNQTNCITSCCWVSEHPQVTLDFNKTHEQDLAHYGKSKKFSPEKITFSVSFASWINTAKVTVTPKSAVSNSGLIKLTYKEEVNPERLAQLEWMASYLKTKRNADRADMIEEDPPSSIATPTVKKKTKKTQNPKSNINFSEQAKQLVQKEVGSKIDTYFYQMNKVYNKQEAVFLLSERILKPVATTNESVYQVHCSARAKTGIDMQHLNSSTFSCGNWLVNLANNSVLPIDNRAKLIDKQ